MGLFWLSLIFLCSVHSLGSGEEALDNYHGDSEETGQCETIRNVNLCATLPYNVTRLPNSFGHITQKAVNDSLNARAQEFNVICSELMLFFVCTIHLPICISEPSFSVARIIEPCRSVCEKVKADCNTTLHSKEMKWPDDRQYMCERLPVYNESMCITPEAFVQPVAVDPPTELSAVSVCNGTERTPRVTKGYIRLANFDFAFKGSIVSIQPTPDGNFSIELSVSRVVIKYPPNRKKPDRVHIWSPSKCSCYRYSDCVILEEGKEYFMIGYNDATQDRLSVQHGFILVFPRDRPDFDNIKKWRSNLRKKKD